VKYIKTKFLAMHQIQIFEIDWSQTWLHLRGVVAQWYGVGFVIEKVAGSPPGLCATT